MYDVFLSYASVDNTALAAPWNTGKNSEKATHWVDGFMIALQQALDRELGRRGDARLFIDTKEIRPGDNFTEKITAALKETKLLVCLVSTGYFDERCWCKMERKRFIEQLGAEPFKTRRIIGVLLDDEILPIWRKDVSSELMAFPFYTKDVEEKCSRLGEGEIDKEFVTRIGMLARELANRIREIELSDNQAFPGIAVARSVKDMIFLPAVPGELEQARTELALFLSGEGWDVLPKENLCDDDPDKCKQEAQQFANQAIASVQILSAYPWKPHPYDDFQINGAKGADRPVFRYRDSAIDLSSIRNEEHRRRLEAPDICARSPLQMQKEIKDKLEQLLIKRKAATWASGATAGGAYVTLSVANLERKSLGANLANQLEAMDVYSLMPDDNFQEFEQCFLNDHGLIAIFGNEPYRRIEQTLLAWRRVLAKYRATRSTAPPSAVYLAEPPPADKQVSINMTLPRLRIIKWDGQTDLDGFINDVKSFSQSRAAEAAG